MTGATMAWASERASFTSDWSSLRWGIADNLLRQFARALQRDVVDSVRHTHNLNGRHNGLNALDSGVAPRKEGTLFFTGRLLFRHNQFERALHASVQFDGGLIPHGADNLQVVFKIQARRDRIIIAQLHDMQHAVF